MRDFDSNDSRSVETLLQQIAVGERAKQELFEVVYEEFRRIAHSLFEDERESHTLQPTALANEAFARLVQSDLLRQEVSKRYFFGAAANAMRRILVEYARNRNARKRGGDVDRIPFSAAMDRTLGDFEKQNGISLLEMQDSLEMLSKERPRQYEVLLLRFFGGYSVEETAECVSISPRTVKSDTSFAIAWLKTQMAAG